MILFHDRLGSLEWISVINLGSSILLLLLIIILNVHIKEILPENKRKTLGIHSAFTVAERIIMMLRIFKKLISKEDRLNLYSRKKMNAVMDLKKIKIKKLTLNHFQNICS